MKYTELGFFARYSIGKGGAYVAPEIEDLYSTMIYDEIGFHKKETQSMFNDYFINSLRKIADTEDFTKMNGCNEILTYKRTTDREEYYPDGTPKDGIEYLDRTDLNTRYECLSAYLNRFADNVEKNGIYVYGCYYEGVRGDTIKALAKDSHVSYIYVENIG